MTISSSATDGDARVPNYARAWTVLRWIGVIPSYLLVGVGTFLAALMFEVFVTGDDNGTSWFAIGMVLVSSFLAVSVAALIAPNFKLTIAVLFALVTLWLVPYPYTMQSSADGEAIPSLYELVGVISGSTLAIALVFFLSKRTQKVPSS